MARPSPVPFFLVVKKGSNIPGISSAEIPEPVSLNLISKNLVSCETPVIFSVVIFMVPLFFIAWAAFKIKFKKTCFKRPESPEILKGVSVNFFITSTLSELVI